MTLPNIVAICADLPLSDADVARQIVAGKDAARASLSLLDCPWNHPTDWYSRACRVAWRVGFRLTREQDQAALIVERKAA